MASTPKTLFTVMSAVILSLVLISAHRHQTEALIIPTDNEPLSKPIGKNEFTLSHQLGGKLYLIDEPNYPNIDGGQGMASKRSWTSLHGSWGKRSADSALYTDTNSYYADGGNDEYADLMVLLNQPYFRNTEVADLNRPVEHETASDLSDTTKSLNEHKRAWTSFSDYWPIRFNSQYSANRNRGKSNEEQFYAMLNLGKCTFQTMTSLSIYFIHDF